MYKKAIAIILALSMLFCISCKKKPNVDISSSSEQNSQPQISSEEESSSNSSSEIVRPEPPIVFSVASMPKVAGLNLNKEDKAAANKKLEIFKAYDTFSKSYHGYPEYEEKTGLTEIPATVDNAYIIYTGYSNYMILDTLRETRDIHKLIELPLVSKKYEFQFLTYDIKDNKYLNCFLDDGYISTSEYIEGGCIVDAFFSPIALEKLKKEMNVKKITEILYFQDGQGFEFYYINTDKGEFMYDTGYHFNAYMRNNQVKTKRVFMTMDEFINYFDSIVMPKERPGYYQ